MGLAGMAAVLPTGPRSDEPLAEAGPWQRWVSTPNCSVCTSMAESHASQPDSAQARLGDARSAEDESPAA